MIEDYISYKKENSEHYIDPLSIILVPASHIALHMFLLWLNSGQMPARQLQKASNSNYPRHSVKKTKSNAWIACRFRQNATLKWISAHILLAKRRLHSSPSPCSSSDLFYLTLRSCRLHHSRKWQIHLWEKPPLKQRHFLSYRICKPPVDRTCRCSLIDMLDILIATTCDKV